MEHRAIDAAGNLGPAASYRATVLPGSSPMCTRTLTGRQPSVTVSTGVTCLTNAQVTGQVTVRPGASLVMRDSTVSGTSRDVTLAGNRFNGAVVLTGNTQVTANERYSRLAGPYGPVMVGNQVTGALSCSGNSASVKDFGAPNTVRGAQAGC
ncbi:hypothetical protein GCM10009557_64540 [Virgisporangium ochraceum]|uniref:Uncharacterized protein n=1 Tax=Virgisporangium ochraceum TaxID=65505 RepID=A0A8J4EB82_9ACTN|nr:hypothetical protein [Virgisporangium ochraceum]GIJ68319.1 hypothetical protein Voc01_032360 [Virgisporangium ochraceum]